MRIRTPAIIGLFGALLLPRAAQATLLSPAIANIYVSSMDFTWTSTTTASGYLLDASTAANFSVLSVSLSVPGVSSASGTLAGLSANTTYFTRVGAVIGGTTSYDGLAGVPTLSPLVSGFFISQVSSNSLQANWTALLSTQTIGYQVQASTMANFSGTLFPVGAGGFAATSAVVPGLASSTTYYVRVGAINSAFVPNYTFIGSTRTAASSFAAPTGLAGTATTPTSIDWTWALVGPATGYHIYQATSPSTQLAELVTTPYTQMGLPANSSASIVVSAVGGGQESVPSSSATVYTRANLPTVPSISNIGSSSFTVTWGTTQNPSYTPYQIEVAANSAFTVGVTTPIPFSANLTANTTNIIGLAPTTTYWVRVTARNGDGILTNPGPPMNAITHANGTGTAGGGSGLGTLTLLPGNVPEGGVVTATATFKVPVGGMSAGGRLEIDLPSAWWPTNLQNNNPAQDGYVTVTSTAAVAFNLSFGNGLPAAIVSFSSGFLGEATLIHVAFNNVHPNCPTPTQNFVTWGAKSAMSAADALGDIAVQSTQTFTTGQVQWVGYNPWNMLTVAANQPSQALTIQTNDNCGLPVPVASDLDVALQGFSTNGTVDAGASFSSNSSFTAPITTVTIIASSSSATYYYRTSSIGTNQIRGAYISPVNANPQQVWRPVNVLAGLPTLSNLSVDNGVVAAGQQSMTLSPDGSGTNNFAYVRFKPSDNTTQWHVSISSNNFQTIVFDRWGIGDPFGTVSWDGRTFPAGTVAAFPQTVPNGTYTVKVELVGLVVDTSLSIIVNSAQITGTVRVGGVAVQGAQVNAQGTNTPGFSFAITDAAGHYTLNGLRTGYQYNLYANYVSSANQSVVTGQLNNVPANATGRDFSLSLPTVLRVSAVMVSSAAVTTFGSINVHSSDYLQNYFGNLRLLAGATTSDNGDPFNPSSWTVLYVQPGSYVIHPFLPGFGTSDINVNVTTSSDVVISLLPKASLFGTITLPAPVANPTWISVEGVLQGNTFPTAWGGASFNVGQSSGVYSVYSVDPGVYTLRVRPMGYIPATYNNAVNNVTVAGFDQSGFDFSTFSTGGQISGQVTVNGDTTALNDPFTLWISAYSPSLGLNVFSQVQLAADAHTTSVGYQLQGVADGVYQLFPPYLQGFEVSPPGPQSITVTNGSALLNITLNQVTGRITGAVTLPQGNSDYGNVHLSIQGPYQREVNLGAGSVFHVDNLGTGNYSLIATYQTTGAEKRTSFVLSNGQTLPINIDLSQPTYSVSGSVSVQNAFTVRDSNNALVTVNTVADLLASATTQVLYLGGTVMQTPAAVGNACSGGTPLSTTTARVEAFPKNFNSFGNATRSNFNNCFGVGQYKYAVIDSSGHYTIPGLSPGVWEVSVYPYFDNGQVPNAAVTKQILTIVNADATGVNFPLSNGYSVSGTVSLPAGVTDNRSFTAQILTPRGDLFQSAPVMITGAGSVAYQFTGLPSDSYSLLIQDMGTFDIVLNRSVIKYVSKPVQFTIAGADLTSVNVTLARASSIVGKLLIQGADGTATLITSSNLNLLPNNFRISANANPWTPGGFGQAEPGMSGGIGIDSNNQFHIDGLAAATYDVAFRQDSFGISVQGAGSINIASLVKGSVQVGESQTVDLGTVNLVPGLSLSGTVSDQSGNGLANIPVEASPGTGGNNGQDTIRVFTDAQGNFVLTGLNPAIKIYSVIAARRPDSNDTSTQPVPYGAVSKLAVDVTQVPMPTLTFVLPSATAQLTGKVVTVDNGSLSYPEKDNGGFPVAAIYVRSQGTVNEDNPLGDVSATALDGTFSIPYLPAGTYDITVESLGYRPLRLTGVTLATGAKDLGTLTLQKGPSLIVTLTKPDGSNVNTTDVKFAVAGTADLSSIIFGQIVSDANTSNITSIKFSGFELSPKIYSLLLFDNQDNIVVPPEGKGIVFAANSDALVKAITYQPSAPFAFTHIRKVGSTVAISYYFSRPIRNRGDDQDPTQWFLTSAHPERLSGHSLSADRRQLTVTYTPVAGEQNAVVKFSASTVDVDPATGLEFVLSKTVTLLLGQKATAENHINPALGGSVTLSDNSDPSSVAVPSNALLTSSGTQADASTSYAVTFSATDDITSDSSALSRTAGARTLSAALDRGAAAYVSEAYQAMRAARASAAVDPFSSFYSVLLPAGISHTLNQNATLTLNYSTDADPALINVYYYNGVEYLLEGANRVIDTVNHTISVSVSHFSTFVVLQNDSQVVVVDGDASSAGDLSVMNFPNPFDLQTKTKSLTHGGTTTSLTTDGTIIRYEIPAGSAAPAKIDIYNVVGEKVRTLDLGIPPTGTFQYVAWDGKNDAGSKVASGVYIGVFKVGGTKKFWKMAVIK